MKNNIYKFWNGFLLATVFWLITLIALYFIFYKPIEIQRDRAIPAYLEKMQRERPFDYWRAVIKAN